MPAHDDLPDDRDSFDHDAFDRGDDLLARLRPDPPRSWRDRFDDLVADPPPWGRVVGAIVVVAVVAVVGLRVLAPPPTPAETGLPMAQPASSAGSDPGAGGGAGAAGDATTAGAPGPATGAGPGAAATSGATAGADGAGGAGATGAGPSGAPVVVHVVGAVGAPGVQRLPAGSRVVDAVAAAGGAAADADLARVNLAAVLVDGQQVVILRPGELPPVGVAPGPGGAGGPAAGPAGDGPIDINTASPTELEDLPGVGPTTAEAIVSHREQQGPFASVDDLLDVRGIGEAKLEQLRAHATV